ncbi:MAG: MBL fold metallo-hydrolase [Candidatus Diapherotrites archaeon]|nr:MBL fold metallo-hydrolase [Candidatus Diapherotrites archaeon]
MFERVCDGVCVLRESGFGSNIYLLNSNGQRMLIDTGIDKENLLGALSSVGLSSESINGVLNTHNHFDHIACSHLFKPVFMGLEDARTLTPEQTYASLFNEFNPVMPVVHQEIGDGDTIKCGKINIEVFSTPGHSKGSVVFFDRKNKLLFSGDLLFSGGNIGRVDLDGGNLGELKQSLEKISALDFETLLPGHGPVSKNAKSDLKKAFMFF